MRQSTRFLLNWMFYPADVGIGTVGIGTWPLRLDPGLICLNFVEITYEDFAGCGEMQSSIDTECCHVMLFLAACFNFSFSLVFVSS